MVRQNFDCTESSPVLKPSGWRGNPRASARGFHEKPADHVCAVSGGPQPEAAVDRLDIGGEELPIGAAGGDDGCQIGEP